MCSNTTERWESQCLTSSLGATQGIVMDFKAKMIIIDEIILPMRNIKNLTNTKVQEAWAISNVLAHEPISTEQATQRAVKILDAN
jgi:hypothetical protein